LDFKSGSDPLGLIRAHVMQARAVSKASVSR
jgi:hypothetical protein